MFILSSRFFFSKTVVHRVSVFQKCFFRPPVGIENVSISSQIFSFRFENDDSLVTNSNQFGSASFE